MFCRVYSTIIFDHMHLTKLVGHTHLELVAHTHLTKLLGDMLLHSLQLGIKVAKLDFLDVRRTPVVYAQVDLNIG